METKSIQPSISSLLLLSQEMPLRHFQSSFANVNTLLLVHNQSLEMLNLLRPNHFSSSPSSSSSSSRTKSDELFLPKHIFCSSNPSPPYKKLNKSGPRSGDSCKRGTILFSTVSASVEIQGNLPIPASKSQELPISSLLNHFQEDELKTLKVSSSGRSLPLSSTSLSSLKNAWNPIDTPPERSKPSQSVERLTALAIQPKSLLKSLPTLEKTLIGAMAGGIAGAFTYACLHPLDTIKTKLQAKGASQIYSSALDAVAKTFQAQGFLGFYSGLSAAILGSAVSSAVYFGTCEFGKSALSKLPHLPLVLIPPTAGALGNIVSSAIMVPKELITQRLQAGSAAGGSWQVLLNILETDGLLGLYAGYSATLLRNLPAGVLSYSSFEYLKSTVLQSTGKDHLEPLQSVICGALAGAISASLTTPLDVVKTRLMTQLPGEANVRIGAYVYGGVSATVKQILKEEGCAGLARGMGPRVLYSACFSAIGYFAFETARLVLLQQYILRGQRKCDQTKPLSDCL